MGLDQIRPTPASNFHRSDPSEFHTSMTPSRATTISIVPSSSRSATAGEPSHASSHRSASVRRSVGGCTVVEPPPGAAAHEGGGGMVPPPAPVPAPTPWLAVPVCVPSPVDAPVPCPLPAPPPPELPL